MFLTGLINVTSRQGHYRRGLIQFELRYFSRRVNPIHGALPMKLPRMDVHAPAPASLKPVSKMKSTEEGRSAHYNSGGNRGRGIVPSDLHAHGAKNTTTKYAEATEATTSAARNPTLLGYWEPMQDMTNT